MDAGKRPLESPPQPPAAKRRIAPIPAAATNGVRAASEDTRATSPKHVAPVRLATPDKPARKGGENADTAAANRPESRAGGSESDRSDDEDEDEESRQARLHNMSTDEVEQLIWGEQGLLDARDEADHCAAMLEGGASDRLPGEVCPCALRRAGPPASRAPSASSQPSPPPPRTGGRPRQGVAGAAGGGGRLHG